jgi:hypothetical protein
MWMFLTLVTFAIMSLLLASTPFAAAGIGQLILGLLILVSIFIFFVSVLTPLEALRSILNVVDKEKSPGIRSGLSRYTANWLEYLLSLTLSIVQGNPFARIRFHPALWDELLDFRLAGTDRLLLQCLLVDFSKGLRLILKIATNQSQRWAIQRSLSSITAQSR